MTATPSSAICQLPSALLRQHFESLADTPDAVPKLRALILDLAVHGKLVAQDPDDEPALELLKRIQSETQHLVKHGRSKALMPLPAMKPDELPFRLPPGWEWVRLGNIGDTNIGLTYSPQDLSDRGVPVLRSNNIQNGKLALSELVRVDAEVKESVLVNQGDLLICARNGSRALVGKTAIIPELQERTAFGAFMAVFRSSLNNYIYHFICSPLFRQVLAEVNTTTINQITQNTLRTTPVPIPPLPEQRRIVAKVEELLALCDELEARQTATREHRTRLVHSALDHLTAAKDEQDFLKQCSFILHNSSLILDSVPALRQAILSLAVQGRLVPQDPAEGDGSVLVEQILKDRGLKPAAATNADGNAPALPANWGATSAADVFEVVGGIQKTPIRSPRNNAYPYLRVANVQRGRLVLHDVRKFELFDGELDRWRLEPNDLLVVEGNGSEDEIGRCAKWNGEIANCVHQNHIIRCRPIGHDSSFVLLFLNSPVGIEEMKRRAITTSGLYSLSVGKIRSLPIPFPPLAEQQRIVAKVDNLMRWCDALEARLAAVQTTATHLLDATLDRALKGES
jgi:type I restriction enzyme S subunit